MTLPTPELQSLPIILSVQRLSFAWPSGAGALDDVSFTMEQGESVAMVGPGGAGKSTLLLHVNGLLPHALEQPNGKPSPACIRVDGLPVDGSNVAQVRRRVGLLFQDSLDQLLSSSVAEDVAFGPRNMGLHRDEIHNRVAESLKAVNLSGYEDRGPLRLSPGEQKRVCLAGVLACRPKLLLLDEPSGSLDPRARRSLLSILKDFSGSLLVATHDLDFAVELCPRTIVLDDGRIHADGPTWKVLADAPLMEKHGLEVPLRLSR